MTKIYFITGASGVGKTTLVEQLEKKYNTKGVFLHFDSIGIPSVEEMIKQHGSPSGWQEAMTYKWIDNLIQNYEEDLIFFEGQVNLQFIQNGFTHHGFKDYKIILVDCSEEEMSYRLTHKRNQPELLTEDMRNWLKFLRNQAEEMGVSIIDTTKLAEEDLIKEFSKKIRIF